MSDKEGFFVVLPEGNFAEIANAAVQKNFRQVTQQPAKIKDPALELLSRLNLKKVTAETKKEKNFTLEVFFAVKKTQTKNIFLHNSFRARYLVLGGFDLFLKAH